MYILKVEYQRILNLPDKLVKKQPIVLFDGECTLCSNSVSFLLRHNRIGNLSFASLQSETGLKIIKLAGPTFQQADTVLLLQDNKLYGCSSAALRITSHLGFPFHLLRILILVPAFIRDAVYHYIARNRYKWFGKNSYCIPDEKGYRERFLS